MVTLKEIVDKYGNFVSDEDKILLYFTENNLESQALEMIPKLAKSQVEKINKKYNYVKVWLLNTAIPCDSKGNRFSQDIEDKFRIIVNHHLLDEELPEKLIEWAKEEIPKMEMPRIFFVPAYEWLKEKYNIKFKNDKY